MILQDKLAKMVILNKIDLNLSEHNEYRFEYINDTFHHITLIYLHKYQYVAQIRKSLFPHKLHLEEFVKIFITARSELVSRSFSQPASLSIFNERFLRKKKPFATSGHLSKYMVHRLIKKRHFICYKVILFCLWAIPFSFSYFTSWWRYVDMKYLDFHWAFWSLMLVETRYYMWVLGEVLKWYNNSGSNMKENFALWNPRKGAGVRKYSCRQLNCRFT